MRVLRKWIMGCLAGASGLLAAGADTNTMNGFDETKLREIEAAIRKAVEAGETPGALLHLERGDSIFRVAMGQRSVEPEEKPLAEDTIYDVASLTKVVSTAPAILLLAEWGELELDAPVARYISEFAGEERDAVTVRHLLTHTSGLRAGLGYPTWSGREKAIELASEEELRAEPGAAFLYSDINFILLGEIVARVSGIPLEDFVKKNLFDPLGMSDTGYLPSEEKRHRIAPTQQTADGMLHGVVHDPTARAMDGVAGHAGVFSTVDDLARYARMILNEGELDGLRLFSAESIREMTSVQTAEAIGVRRGLGWDIDSQFSRPRGKFPLGSFGHTGWTGPCMWIDPFSQTFWLFLSNRVHPDGSGNVIPLQRELAGLVVEAITDFDFDDVPGALEPLSP